ncbi:MAG: serine--tRNA ligase [Candidatus Micrarchaeia archaeon]
MLDIELFRKNPEIIKESERKRFRDPSRVDEVIRLDVEWRTTQKKMEMMRKKRNEVSIKVGEMKKSGKDVQALVSEMRVLGDEISKMERVCEELIRKRDEIRYTIGNILHKDVPVAKDESGNRVIRKWGEVKRPDFEPVSHVDLLVKRGFVDLERAAEISGARFYYLKGELVKLNLALISYALDMLTQEGYILMHTPFIMKAEYMKGAAELGDFENTLYKIEGEDCFLIATAEQTLASYHAGQILNEEILPLKYAGVSACFRKEAGAHGKDTKGIFRVHQFEKVEQYVYCLPEESWEWHEKMIKISERILQGLELPYRVVDIASGDMNDSAARKYDIEAWFPVQNKYRELVSGSNTTDYQARKLGVRVMRERGEKEIVHTLNCTALATERTIAAIVENHQDAKGRIHIPEVLWKYMGDVKVI